MRQPPEEFIKGPKATREKLNQLVTAVRENMFIPGVGLRIRETSRGLLVTLDDKILVAAGLANNSQAGRGPYSGNPYGGGNGLGDEEYKPEESDPTEPDPDPQPELPDGVQPPPDPNTPAGDSYPPLRWVTFTLPDAELDESYTASLFAVGGIGTYSYAITGGALPAGLTLSGNTISGTATALGISSVTITVTSGTQSKPANFDILVTATGAVKIIGTNFLGSAFWLDRTTQSTTLTIAGGTGPYAVVINSGTLSPWYNWVVSGTNAPRPPSLVYFSPGSIYESNVQIRAVPNLYVQSGGGILPQTDARQQRMAGYSPQGPRRMSVTVFDSTGASATKTVVLDILWDTSRYVAVSAGPSLGTAFVNYPLWIDKSMYDSSPSSYTLLPSGNWPYVT